MKKILQISVFSLAVGVLLVPDSAYAWNLSNLFGSIKQSVDQVTKFGVNAVKFGRVGIPDLRNAIGAFKSGDVMGGLGHLANHAEQAVSTLGGGISTAMGVASNISKAVGK